MTTSEKDEDAAEYERREREAIERLRPLLDARFFATLGEVARTFGWNVLDLFDGALRQIAGIAQATPAERAPHDYRRVEYRRFPWPPILDEDPRAGVAAAACVTLTPEECRLIAQAVWEAEPHFGRADLATFEALEDRIRKCAGLDPVSRGGWLQPGSRVTVWTGYMLRTLDGTCRFVLPSEAGEYRVREDGVLARVSDGYELRAKPGESSNPTLAPAIVEAADAITGEVESRGTFAEFRASNAEDAEVLAALARLEAGESESEFAGRLMLKVVRP